MVSDDLLTDTRDEGHTLQVGDLSFSAAQMARERAARLRPTEPQIGGAGRAGGPEPAWWHPRAPMGLRQFSRDSDTTEVSAMGDDLLARYSDERHGLTGADRIRSATKVGFVYDRFDPRRLHLFITKF